MDPKEIKKLQDQYNETKASLANVSDQLKDLATESKEAKSLSNKSKETADELLTQQSELKSQLEGLEGQLQDAVQKMSEMNNGPDRPDNRLPGDYFAELVAENDDVVKLLQKPIQGRRIQIDVPRSAFERAMFLNALTEDGGGTGGSLTYPADVRPLVGPLQRRLTIRDLLAPGQTSRSAIFFPRESGFTNNAEIQSEQNVLKGESDLTFEDVTRTVVTIAHFLKVSLQMLDDVPYLQSYINTRLLYGLGFVEENQFLLGSGTGQNIEGIHTAATEYSEPVGLSIDTETIIDRLRAMMLQVELADAMATGVIMHPTDWANIELTKDGDKRYIVSNPMNTTTGRLWGRNVVATKAMTQGNGLTGDFAAHAQVLDRQDANVAISFEDGDNFRRNMATLRAEERTVLAIYRPEAFVKGSLDSLSSD